MILSSSFKPLPSSTVINPSFPTSEFALATISPIFLSPFAEIVATFTISSYEVTPRVSVFIAFKTSFNALSIPCLISSGLAPAVTFLIPNRYNS